MKAGNRLGIRGVALAAMVLLFALTACAPERDPLNVADVYATQAEADRLTAQSEYELQQQAIVDEIANAEAQTKLEIFQATQDRLIETAHTAINILSVVGIATMAVFMIQTSRTAVDVTRRGGEAAAAAVELRATLIPLSLATRTFPLQLKEIDGAWFVIDHTNHGVYRIDEDGKPADGRLIAAFMAAQQTGLLAMEARKSKGKAGSAKAFANIVPQIGQEIISLANMTGDLVPQLEEIEQ